MFIFFFSFFSFFLFFHLKAQSFYQEKEPKTDFYRIGLGAGTFFAAPKPSYDKIENQIVPVLSLGFGRRYNDHFSLRSTFSFQQFSSDELLIQEGTGLEVSEPIFQGYNYALDITPTVNLMPSFHHMSRPILDLYAGLGLGYLLTYRTEKFIFKEKDYEFSFFESSFYFPARVSAVIRLGILSDLEVEGAFFYTFLNDSKSEGGLKKDSDHFGQLNLVYRRYLK
ncbi:hypothetical protein [Algoriphagus boritolerans]|uniref:hypothetical protein n=1 Tax=Algoriphagus boritolerans TaxID=308111 RepID=UPI0011B08377|nr:hypothetical protein [Algoriphagus boritolerans]